MSNSKKCSASRWKFGGRKAYILNSLDLIKRAENRELLPLEDIEKDLDHFEDLEQIKHTTEMKHVEDTVINMCSVISSAMQQMQNNTIQADKVCELLSKLNTKVAKAWDIPAFGNEIGKSLSKMLQNNGGLDMLIENCASKNKELQFCSAKLLLSCLTSENRVFIVDKGLDKVVDVAKNYTVDINNIAQSQVGTGILEQLFRHSEVTCGDVIALGGLDTVINMCTSKDDITKRHCASALANVGMYSNKISIVTIFDQKYQVKISLMNIQKNSMAFDIGSYLELNFEF